MKVLSQNRPASADKAVLFSVDETYFPYALFVAAQIAETHPERDFDICILSATPLPAHPLLARLGIRTCVLEPYEKLAGLDVSARLSVAAYLRILAPQALKDDYKRILYMDADIFYIRGDISRLLDIDLGAHPVGAIRDTQQLKDPTRTPRDFKPLGLPSVKYFNSGVLLMDVARCNEMALTDKVISFAITNLGKLIYHDQTALNGVLMGDWAELSPVWNFQYSHKTAFFSGMFDVCFMHFSGSRKPFKGGYSTTPKRFNEPYRKFFAEHFSELNIQVDSGLEVSQHRAHIAVVCLLHLFTFRKFLVNEDRWLDEWDVK